MNYIDYSNFFGVGQFKAFMSNRDQDYAILENRRSFVHKLGLNGNSLVLLRQVHSKEVAIVSAPCTLPGTDGAITEQKDIVLSIQVADCIPLFLFHKTSHIIGLIHSGWRGTQLGIGSVALQKIVNGQPEEVMAVIGPSIDQCCFEVGPEVANEFDSLFSVKGSADRQMLDLKSIVKKQLVQAGLLEDQIFVDKHCTYCEKDRFFSYRRDGDKAGRMVAIAGWSQTFF